MFWPRTLQRPILILGLTHCLAAILSTGLEHPQHLLVLEDGNLLVSDFGAGIIYRVTRR